MTEPGTLGAVTGPGLPRGPEPASGAGNAFRPRQAHRCYLEVPAEPGAVPYARRCTRRTLATWGLGPVADDAELVVSELITNAVRAALVMPSAAHVVLYLAADPGRLTLLVWDACPESPVCRPHDEDSAGGRGLESCMHSATGGAPGRRSSVGKSSGPGSTWTAHDRVGRCTATARPASYQGAGDDR